MMRRATLISLAVLFCYACKSPDVIWDTFQHAYNEEGVAGTWFGFAQADVFLYRIELSPSGSGVGAYSSYVSESPKRFAITKWQLDARNHLSVRIPTNSVLSHIEGNLATDTMFLGTVYGATGWSNSVTFYKEEPFERRMKQLREIVGGDSVR